MGIEAMKAERDFLNKIKEMPDKVFLAQENADQEGFAYFASEAYLSKPGTHKPSMRNKIRFTKKGDRLKLLKMMTGIMPKMMGGIKHGFQDVDDLLSDMAGEGWMPVKDGETKPDQDLWEKLEAYAWDKWQVKLGFTYMPSDLIFKGKGVLFPYTIVCIQEMEKSEIDKAPEIEAGKEVQRVYASLGIAVNDIANWLRNNYNIKCHANHPLGGLVNTTPLAAKAGMGWQGKNGLLITPEFGQRQRIAPIFVESKLFEYTDSQTHWWIENFCGSCGKCERSCPAQAIYPDKKINQDHVEGLGQTRTCIDREKCYDFFNQTLGCSVCVKVCPFSAGNGVYDKLKKSYEKRSSKLGA